MKSNCHANNGNYVNAKSVIGTVRKAIAIAFPLSFLFAQISKMPWNQEVVA